MATLAELQTPEAALKAALPESAHIVDNGAAQIRKARLEKRLKEGGATGALESLKGHTNKPDSDRILKANIGSDVNPDGTKNLNAQERALLSRGQKAEKLNQAAGDGKYDALTNNEKIVVRGRVESIMRRVPQLDAMLTTLAGNKEAYLDQIIKDPAFMSVVREINNSKLVELETDGQDLDAKRAEWKQKDEIVQAKEATLKGIEDKLALVTRKLAESRGLDLSALDPATRQTNINAAVSRSEAYRTSTFSARAEAVDKYITYRDKLAELELAKNRATGPEKARISREITHLQAISTVKDTTGFGPDQNTYLGDRDTIERSKIDVQKGQLTAEQNDAKEEVESAKKERAQADTEKAIAQHRRNVAETKFVDSLDGVLTEATVKYLQDMTKESEEIRAAEIAKMQEVQTDKQKADVQQLLSTRWDRVRARSGIFRRELNRVDKNAVSTDYDTLLSQGPRQLMESIIPAAGAPPAMTTEQRNKLLGDTELQSQFVATLLQKRMETSSFSSTEVRRIVGTTWGKEAIIKALDQNTAAKAVITRLEGEGYMKGGFMDWLSKKDDRSILAILGAILGGTAAGIAGGAFAAGAIATAAGAGAEVVGGSMVAGGAAGGILGGIGGGAAANRLT